jgi:sporulation-control protein spo0M
VIFFLEEGENLDIFMEIDRQARGLKSWFQEITDTDESHVKISLNSEQLNLDFDELTSFFDRAIQKRLES